MLGLGHMLCTDLLTRAPCLQGGISPATRPMTGAGRPLTGFARPGTGSTRPGTGGVEAAFQGGRPGTSRPVTSGGRCAGAWARTSAGAYHALPGVPALHPGCLSRRPGATQSRTCHHIQSSSRVPLGCPGIACRLQPAAMQALSVM